ncbi:hypothetical protein RJ639_031352, partial [Escallonia herrerae]
MREELETFEDVKNKGCREIGAMTGKLEQLVRHYLLFRVTTNDGKMVQSDNVALSNWKFGHVFKGKQYCM